MGRKTVADLERELEELKVKNKELAEAKNGVDEKEVVALIEENKQLKKDINHSKESEARLLNEIENVGDMAANGDFGGCRIMTPDEYAEYSIDKGLIMGRRPNQKTKPSIEELRATINSNRTPKWFMEKHGLTAEDLKQLIWKLSKKEMRDKPIKYSIERDTFSKEG